MARIVDMTKPLKDQDPDDLRYALDRNLITDRAERQRAFKFLAAAESGEPDDTEDTEEPDDGETYDPADHKVDDVIAWAEADDVSAEQVEAVIELEKGGKNRSSLLAALEAMLVPADETEAEES